MAEQILGLTKLSIWLLPGILSHLFTKAIHKVLLGELRTSHYTATQPRVLGMVAHYVAWFSLIFAWIVKYTSAPPIENLSSLGVLFVGVWANYFIIWAYDLKT